MLLHHFIIPVRDDTLIISSSRTGMMICQNSLTLLESDKFGTIFQWFCIISKSWKAPIAIFWKFILPSSKEAHGGLHFAQFLQSTRLGTVKTAFKLRKWNSQTETMGGRTPPHPELWKIIPLAGWYHCTNGMIISIIPLKKKTVGWDETGGHLTVVEGTASSTIL